MVIFEFSGFGNYSNSSCWDNGLSVNLGKETTFEKAVEAEQNAVSTLLQVDLPQYPQKGIFWQSNEHGGSRNVVGYVIADDSKEAETMAKELENHFPYIPYERDNDL